MLQTVLMFLAQPQNVAQPTNRPGKFPLRMATPAKIALAQSATAGQNAYQDENRVTWLTIAGNALGFFLLMTGLWLVLHLAEVLLA